VRDGLQHLVHLGLLQIVLIIVLAAIRGVGELKRRVLVAGEPVDTARQHLIQEWVIRGPRPILDQRSQLLEVVGGSRKTQFPVVVRVLQLVDDGFEPIDLRGRRRRQSLSDERIVQREGVVPVIELHVDVGEDVQDRLAPGVFHIRKLENIFGCRTLRSVRCIEGLIRVVQHAAQDQLDVRFRRVLGPMP
jgi:hypothetical protein